MRKQDLGVYPRFGSCVSWPPPKRKSGSTSTFHRVMVDLVGVERTTAGKKIRNVIAALVSLSHHFIRMPETAAAVNACKRQFYEITGFPGVIGAIDCTHVPILCPASTDAELYRNRKEFMPINVQVQAICDARYASLPSAINAPLLLGADKYGPAPPPALPRPAPRWHNPSRTPIQPLPPPRGLSPRPPVRGL